MTSSLVPKVPPDSTHISGYDICSDNNDIVDINSTTNIFDTSNILPTTSILVPKGSYNFVCECCDFKCSRQSQYDRHLSTRKHKDTYNGYKIDIISTKKVPKSSTCVCICGTTYKHRQSLYNHKKKCSFVQKDTEEDTKEDTKEDNISLAEKMVEMVMSKNQEFMSEFMGKMMELIPKIGNNTNTNCNNTNNNQFNINMFLNDHCKDAMNIKDFINSLPITTQMYDDINKKGTAEVLTNTMIEGLNKMEVVERPIHCMDKKRKVMYVKDDDNWEKDINNEKMTDTAEIILSKIRTNFKSLWTDNKQKLINKGDDVTQNIWADIANKVVDVKLVDVPHNGIFLKRLAENTYLDKEFKDAIASGNTSLLANM
tara:strand:+ start:301 stop:1410 length:1110 start_codon:yes stop_codon:yes gene_type:complete